jgi:hypothetical protein
MWKIFISPKIVAYIIMLFLGRPDLADDLIAICDRESRCTLIGAHKIDAHISNKEWFSQVKLEHIDPSCQERKAKGGWATHGPWGLSAGAHWKHVPPCYKPKNFDNPYISGLIAGRKYIRKCWGLDQRSGWCHVPKKVRMNNLKSPKWKKPAKWERPQNWWDFMTMKTYQTIR